MYASRDSHENITSSPIIALLRHAKTEETVLRTSSDMSVIVLRDSPDHIVRLHLTRATQILANMEHAFCRGASHKCVCESGFSGPTCDQPNSSQMTITQVTYPDLCIASASVCNEPAKCKAVGPQDLSAFVRKRIKQEMTIVLYRITTRNTGFAVLRIRVRVTQLYVE